MFPCRSRALHRVRCSGVRNELACTLLRSVWSNIAIEGLGRILGKLISLIIQYDI